MRLSRLALVTFGAPFLAAEADAQFVGLRHCRSAIPCSVPFAVRYRPDPLIAAQYGEVTSAVSAHVALEKEAAPKVDRRPTPDSEKAVEASVKLFLQKHPSLEKTRPPVPTPAKSDPPRKPRD